MAACGQKQPTCPVTDESAHKTQPVHVVECYSASKRREPDSRTNTDELCRPYAVTEGQLLCASIREFAVEPGEQARDRKVGVRLREGTRAWALSGEGEEVLEMNDGRVQASMQVPNATELHAYQWSPWEFYAL